MNPSVSLVICTRNRAEDLRQTLASLGRARVPEGWQVELLVVDNGSTDDTHAVVQAAVLPGLSLRYLREPQKGKSRACNAALAAAKGDIFLFTDDDIRVTADWISGMCRPIVEGKADAVAGGIVFPPRVAFALSLDPYCSRRSWFASSEYLNPDQPEAMIGANMAFHRRVLEKVPGFDVELGTGALGMEEETLFSKQLRLAGFRLIAALDVAVEHHFDLARTSPANMREIARRKGRSDAFVFYHWEHQRSRFVVPRLLFFLVWQQWVRLTDRLSRGAPGSVSGQALRLEGKLAFCREYINQRNRPRKYDRFGLAPRAPV